MSTSAEKPKLAAENSNGHTENFEFDLPRALMQYLNSLSESGLQVLPAAAGRLSPTMLHKWLQRYQIQPAATVPADLTGKVAEGPTDYQQTNFSVASGAVIADTVIADIAIADPAGSEAIGLPGVSPPNQQNSDRKPNQITEPTVPVEALKVLQAQVESCQRCPELVACRSKTVFGVGNPQPRLVLLGEAPGADEDRQGVPFVGAAGQLLDKILHACCLKREEIYILNTVKCRPPRNRNPLQEELDNCWEYTLKQIEILNPEFICCLGSVAAKRLLQTEVPLGKLRQRFHQFRGIRVIVTYHPAYLLRTESAKKHVWADMKILLKEMGIDLPN